MGTTFSTSNSFRGCSRECIAVYSTSLNNTGLRKWRGTHRCSALSNPAFCLLCICVFDEIPWTGDTWKSEVLIPRWWSTSILYRKRVPWYPQHINTEKAAEGNYSCSDQGNSEQYGKEGDNKIIKRTTLSRDYEKQGNCVITIIAYFLSETWAKKDFTKIQLFLNFGYLRQTHGEF